MFCLKLGIFFSSNSISLLYIQQISPQFIYCISVSTCGEFYISYSITEIISLFSVDFIPLYLFASYIGCVKYTGN